MTFDVAIIGAGPAGLKAARKAGKSTVLIDDNPQPGGQIWRGDPGVKVPEGVTFLGQTRVFDIEPGFTIHTIPHGAIRASRIVLATGSRELFLPFPGWTSPGVFGAGGLQALVKSGLAVSGKRVLVAGSGPLLLAVAATLRKNGARIAGIAEQAPFARIFPFLLRNPVKLPQAILLRTQLLGVPYWTGTWVTRFANGRATLSSGRSVDIDYLACGFGLVPNTELAELLGGVEGVSSVREPSDRAFVQDMETAFRLDPRLYDLAEAGTIVCRCEDVTRGALEPYREWRHAKLQTRCGMGPCQGRICGPIVSHLFGWTADSVRTPVVPVPASELARPTARAGT